MTRPHARERGVRAPKKVLPLLRARQDKRGLLIAFEGPDGSGKTTQRKLFTRWLESQGHVVVTTKWGSSRLVKPLLSARRKAHALSPEELCLLQAADFRHRLEQEILPALWRGTMVVADRFLFTGLARDAARGLDLDWVLHAYLPVLARHRLQLQRLARHVHQPRRSQSHAEVLRRRAGRHEHHRSRQQLQGLRVARDSRGREPLGNLPDGHRRRRAADLRTAQAHSPRIPGEPADRLGRVERRGADRVARRGRPRPGGGP